MPAEQVDHGIVIGVARGATLRRFVGVSAAALALAGIVVGVSGGGPGPSREGTNSREYATAVERISPGSLAGAPAAQSPEEQARLERGLVDLRADLARGATGAASTSADETSSDAPATTAVQAPEFHGAPNGFLTVSRENTLADDAGRANQVSSPVAVTQASQVFMAGRSYASFSTDNGNTWPNANVIAIPAGPAEAPKFLGNIDAVYDQARGVTLYSLLYGRSYDGDTAPDNGVVVIVVRRKINLANNCTYAIDPDGASNNVLPDLPHLGLSTNFLYLGTSEVVNEGSQTAKVRRFALDSVADCVSAATNTFSLPAATVGARVLRPADGARQTMYFGAVLGSSSSTTFRLFRWPETSASVSSSDFALGATSLFGNADCRGGTNNTDWWDASAASSMGQSLVGAVGRNRISFYWNTAASGVHPQGHVHGITIDEAKLTKVGDPAIWNPAYCLGFLAVAANERGDLGFSLPNGGEAGGGGPALGGWVGILDDYAGGSTDFVIAATGTHNPNLATFGEVSARSNEHCDYFWTATNYVFAGAGQASNIDADYVKFGRGRDSRCLN